MKTKIIYLLLLLIIAFSCKKESTTIKSETIIEAQDIQLKLNSGKKWLANQETHDGIKAMDSLIKTFKTESKNDYKALAKNLSEQTSYVIKKCNMKGESHDQLHAVLVPMLDNISVLKDADDNTISEAALHTLETLIEDYFNHFKI